MLENLAPERVFHYFEKICSIPHGSGNTDKIRAFCVNFAAEHGLEHTFDAHNNVLIRKKASRGYENHPPVILQGHMDMVCEKTPDCPIDFTKDGLRLKIDGDNLSAEGTTLGADNGIAVAMILAVLEDDSLSHPPLEAVFTTDEETGMYGAHGFDTAKLSGHTFINLDSEEDNALTVGCAGGAKAHIDLPLAEEPNDAPCVKISLSGLLGGHSGNMIGEGRQNADKLLGALLARLSSFRLVSIDGGFKDNAIPNAAECVLATDVSITELTALAAKFVEENRVATDSGLTVTVSAAQAPVAALDKESTDKIVAFLTRVPFGVQAMSKQIPGLVQSSLNLGIMNITTEADGRVFHAVVSVRSSVAAEKQKMLDDLQALAASLGADFAVHGHYPAWEYKENSRLRDIMVAVYEKQYGKKPIIEVTHAGLECGLFAGKIKNFDAVSAGPNMWDVHTVNEHLSISSTERTYTYLCNVLKEL